MKLADMITDYAKFLQHEQGAAKTTCIGYKSGLNRLHRWLEANGYPSPSVEVLTTQTLRRYQYAISGEGLRPRAILSAFHPVSGLCRFLVQHGVMTTDPTKELTLPAKDAAIRHVTTEQEMLMMYEACSRQRDTRMVALCRAALTLLNYGALRNSEARAVFVDDVNLNERPVSLLVRSGKGSKSRQLYLCDEAAADIREWLAVRPKDATKPNLLLHNRSKPVSDEGLCGLIEHIKALAGLQDHHNIHPHAIRRCCATRMMRNGVDLAKISAFLGHTGTEALRTTSLYIRTNEEELRDVAALTSMRPIESVNKQGGSRQPVSSERHVQRFRRTR